MSRPVRHPCPNAGFTLLELAIVLTIIALIIGGIMVGRGLIRVSQLNAVASEVGRYTEAITDFRNKYHALPGDFSGATALWGTMGAGYWGCNGGAATGTSTATCDGNGDGRITVQTADTPASEYEQFLAWKHLANAGLIDGSYSGVAGGGDSMQAIIGTNVPASKLSGAGYSIISIFPNEFNSVTGYIITLGAPHYYAGVNYMHILQLGAATGPKSTLYPVLTTAEALSLDTKLDDGLPSTGKVMGPVYNSAYAPNCTTGAPGAPLPVYDKTQSGIKCSLIFLLGF